MSSPREHLSIEQRVRICRHCPSIPVKFWSAYDVQWIEWKSDSTNRLPVIVGDERIEEDVSNHTDFTIGSRKFRAKDALDRRALVRLVSDLHAVSQEPAAGDGTPPSASSSRRETGLVVEVLLNDSDGTVIRILGVSHDDPQSVDDVKQEIAKLADNATSCSVVVELDEKRLELLREKQAHPPRHGGTYCCSRLLSGCCLSFICPSILRTFSFGTYEGEEYGREFREAVDTCKQSGIRVVLGDLDMTNPSFSHAFTTESRPRRMAALKQREKEKDEEDTVRLLNSTQQQVDEVVRSIRDGLSGPLEGSRVLQTGRDLYDRNLSLTYSALFEATGQERLLIVGWAHVHGICEILLNLNPQSRDLLSAHMTLRRGLALQSPSDAFESLSFFAKCTFGAKNNEFIHRFIITSGALRNIMHALRLFGLVDQQITLVGLQVMGDISARRRGLEFWTGVADVPQVVSSLIMMHLSSAPVVIEGCFLLKRVTMTEPSLQAVLAGLGEHCAPGTNNNSKVTRACMQCLAVFACQKNAVIFAKYRVLDAVSTAACVESEDLHMMRDALKVVHAIILLSNPANIRAVKTVIVKVVSMAHADEALVLAALDICLVLCRRSSVQGHELVVLIQDGLARVLENNPRGTVKSGIIALLTAVSAETLQAVKPLLDKLEISVLDGDKQEKQLLDIG